MGLSEIGKELALAAVLPNGTDVWVALLTTMPDEEDGTGLVEAMGSGYARVAHDAWLNTTADGVTYRTNDGAIEFAALSGALSVVGWAIYDADTGGDLLAFGSLRDVAGEVLAYNFVSTDQPRFIAQELSIGID